MIITPYLSHFTQLHPAAVVPSWRKERWFPEFRSLFDPALSENLVNYPFRFLAPNYQSSGDGERETRG